MAPWEEDDTHFMEDVGVGYIEEGFECCESGEVSSELEGNRSEGLLGGCDTIWPFSRLTFFWTYSPPTLAIC